VVFAPAQILDGIMDDLSILKIFVIYWPCDMSYKSGAFVIFPCYVVYSKPSTLQAGLARLLICRCVCSLPDCWLSKQGVVRQDGSLGIHLGSLWVFIYLYWTVIEERQEKEEQSALYRKNMLHWPLPASSTSENSIKDYFTFISMLLRAEMNWLFEEATEFSYKLIEPLSLLEAKDKLRDTHCGLSLYAFF